MLANIKTTLLITVVFAPLWLPIGSAAFAANEKVIARASETYKLAKCRFEFLESSKMAVARGRAYHAAMTSCLTALDGLVHADPLPAK